jgi:hypothetical protein
LLTRLFRVVVFVVVRVGSCTLSASYAELSRVFSFISVLMRVRVIRVMGLCGYIVVTTFFSRVGLDL